MGTSPRPAAGLIVSAALAALTLTVFANNQLSGPEGALHRFLLAVGEGHLSGAQSVASGRPAAVGALFREVAVAYGYGARYAVVDVRQEGRAAHAQVAFIFPNGLYRRTFWWLVRTGLTWQVDTERTLWITGGDR